jgi:hypothetical protein
MLVTSEDQVKLEVRKKLQDLLRVNREFEWLVLDFLALERRHMVVEYRYAETFVPDRSISRRFCSILSRRARR